MASSSGMPSRENLIRAIDSVPWDYLAHAYAAAPEQLRRFVCAERPGAGLDAALDWLWGSILHQGSVYSASPPVLWVLVDTLVAYPEHPAAEDILGGLATLGEACLFMREEPDASTELPVRCSAPDNPVWEVWVSAPLPHMQGEIPEEYFVACRVRESCIVQTLAHARPVIARCLDHPGENVRRAAAAAWWSVVQVVPDTPNAKGVLEGMIRNPRFEPGVWLSAIIGLDLMGQNVAPLLQDADRRIRLGAAMAEGTRSMTSSKDELVHALRDLEWLEGTFPRGLAHQAMHVRFHVLPTLLDRCSPETAGEAGIDALRNLIMQHASPFTADYEWGRILLWAFPERRAKLPMPDQDMLSLPQRLNAAQRAVLSALTKKSDIWDRKWGNASLALRRVQLPHDRASILRCLAAAARS
jgi:hypothetical protein